MLGIQYFKQVLQSRLERKRTRSQDSDIVLPIELWLDILSHLSQDSVAAISLTSRSLRWIAQPLLFEEDLHFHPFTSSITYRRLQVDSYLARCHDRLDFLSSTRIASHIRSLSLTPFPSGHFLERSPRPHVPENDIVDRFFRILPLLSGLQNLTIQSIKSTPKRIATLESLSIYRFGLETRGDDITWQSMPQGRTLPVPVSARRSLSFNCNASPHQIPTPSVVPLKFLHPATLEEITSGPSGTQSILIAMSVSLVPFVQLVTLDIYTRFVSQLEFIPSLRQCPNLTTLRLRSGFADSPARPFMLPLPPDILSTLDTFHGPPVLAVAFSTDRRIRNFKLWSSRRASSVIQPAKMAPLLRQLGPHVEVLEIGVTTMPPFLVSVIAESFPKLRSLAVNAHLSSYHPGLAKIRRIETRYLPSISVGEAPSLLDLDFLAFGVQIPAHILVGSLQHEDVGLELLMKFPAQYDPTSWDQWAIDLAWSSIIWNRLDPMDRHPSAPGKLSIEHVDYHSSMFRTLD